MEHVTKSYGRRRVLDDVSQTFARGSFTLLVGPNGSGKTTVLRLLSTYLAPSAGRVHWAMADGAELQDPVQVRTRLGFAGHTPLVWDELSVRENLALQLRLRGRDPGAAEPWIERFGLAARADDRAEGLSRGLRQRLALLQALVHEPEFLLLDEPASNLDEASLERLVAALEPLRGRSTVVLATHEPERFASLADHVIDVQDGALRGRGSHA